MATSNFAREHFKNVYAVLDNTDEEIDEWQVQDFKMMVLENIQGEFKKNKRYDVSESDGYDGNRNYGGSYIFEVSTDDDISIRGTLKNGYYSGANLEIELLYEGDVYNGIDDILHDIKAHCQYQGKRPPITRVTKDISRMIKGIERVYKNISRPLIVVATFSNGETIYQG
jgi:hypothetical protein